DEAGVRMGGSEHAARHARAGGPRAARRVGQRVGCALRAGRRVGRRPVSERIRWPAVLDQARAIVESYDTGVTLRQLFYRPVADKVSTNAASAYKTLSARTAHARRAGTFPDLVDNVRSIHAPATFASPDAARTWLSAIYRRDRTEHMDISMYLGAEKATMVAL